MNHRRQILVITDKVSGNFTNGSQVMANAVLAELSRWFSLNIIVYQDEESPTEWNADIIQLDPNSENLNQILFEIIERRQISLIYNFGCTIFSCDITAILLSLHDNIYLINHFQLVLPEYARHEGYALDEVNKLGYPIRFLAERAGINIFPSFSELNRVIGLGWEIQRAKNCVITNAYVPVSDIVEVPGSKPYFSFMAAGRFSDFTKGADLLYRAFCEYYKEYPATHLFIASDSNRFTELLNTIPKNAWTYLGWLSRQELHAKLKEVDVVIVPSRYEPFGLIAVESMAMGTPVISMAVGGLSEIVHHQNTGWLCDPKEGSFGLKIAMQRAIQERKKLSQMGKKSIKVVKDEYALDKMTMKLKRIFDNLSILTY